MYKLLIGAICTIVLNNMLAQSGLAESKGYWTQWATNNTRNVSAAVLVNQGGVTGIEGHEQAGYGLVNLRISNNDFQPDWATRNFGGQIRTQSLSPDEVATGIEVAEQFGFGLINARLLTTHSDGYWLSGNGEWNRVLSLKCQSGYILRGIQVSEQAGYGVTDARAYCAPQ